MAEAGIENLYKEYLTAHNKRWQYGNSVLYRMCKEQPEHKDIDVIVGKIWLIGRSYAAAIERRKNVFNVGDDFYYKEVAPKLMEIGPELDDRIAGLNKSKGLVKDDFKMILSTHKFLVDVFYELTGLEKRSLASKYLHFHCPEKFFIYDSRARKRIRKLVKRPDKRLLTNEFEHDPEYGDFVCRMIELQKYLNEHLGVYELPRNLFSHFSNTPLWVQNLYHWQSFI